MRKRITIGAYLIALLVSFTCPVSAQVSLTALEVRTANLILDECERDRTLLELSEAELQAAKSAIGSLNSILDIAREDVRDLERLDSSRVTNLTVYRKSLKDEQRKSNVRSRLLWILGAVAVVETVVIGVAVAAK